MLDWLWTLLTLVSGWKLLQFVRWLAFGPAVSMPPPPRAHRIRREPRFLEDNFTPVEKGWRFACAEKSHARTEEETGPTDEQLMFGEPAGRQIWYFDEVESKKGGQKEKGEEKQQSVTMDHKFNARVNPNSADKPFREQKVNEWTADKKTEHAVPDHGSTPTTAYEAAFKGLEFYQMLQCEDGHWAGDYGGPHFLMPGLIITCYISGQIDTILGKHRLRAMSTYLRNHQQEDGGWGTHIESPSTMFGSVLSYVSLRLCGVPANDPTCARALKFIHTHGGALFTASWAKFWLSALGVYDWRGVNRYVSVCVSMCVCVYVCVSMCVGVCV
jgi:hypothetical protein